MNKQKIKICIVGGVAGGASTVTRLRRLNEEFEIILFEKDQYISFANCGLPYHISKTIKDRDSLILWDDIEFKKRYNVDVRTMNEVLSIDRQNKNITVLNKNNNQTYQESYDKLVLSPGAKPFVPTIDGLSDSDSDLDKNIFTLRNIADMDKIISHIDCNKIQSALVVGGGFIGVELCENLRKKNIEISLLERADQVMTPFDIEMANILHNEMAINGVKLYLGKTISKATLIRKDSNLQNKNHYHVILNSGEELNVQMILVASGVKPETTLAKNASLEIGRLGGIIVNEYLQTSDPNIYALGDAIEVSHFINHKSVLIPLAGPANKQARVVANNIANTTATTIKTKYQNTLGTSIIKVFELQAATTGLNEKTLIKAKDEGSTDYLSIIIHPLNHAGYYPGSSQMTLKILYHKDSGEILGAQAIGANGVDKRIDIISTIIKTKGTIYHLKDLELCYAPPFSSAKDPINMLGTIADNVKNGLVRLINYREGFSREEFSNNNDHIKDKIFLDVRTKLEHSIGSIPNSINIPLDELRENLKIIDKEKIIIIYCQVGIRAYNAYRILAQNGYKNIYLLSGGYKTYQQFQPFDMNNINKDLKMILTENPSEHQERQEHQLDLCGLQCPGPIMKLKNKLDQISIGDRIHATASDIGFAKDIHSFCKSTGNILVDIKTGNKIIEVIIEKNTFNSNLCTQPSNVSNLLKKNTLIVFSNDLDKVLAAFVLANGARTMGHEVTMFFTFWGLNVLRKKETSSFAGKTILEKMFAAMMPKGAQKLSLSKMHMMKMGTLLMKYIMKKKNVFSLEQMISDAKGTGVKMIACSMSMDIMGIKSHELLDGVEIGGVADYIYESANANGNLFI
ncbi:MAG: FAD-dependent oxidoreductase [Oligoflexia bacterium]|nr:FAD-dependent oxidoreductase [Oligoflexia bacterium]